MMHHRQNYRQIEAIYKCYIPERAKVGNTNPRNVIISQRYQLSHFQKCNIYFIILNYILYFLQYFFGQSTSEHGVGSLKPFTMYNPLFKFIYAWKSVIQNKGPDP